MELIGPVLTGLGLGLAYTVLAFLVLASVSSMRGKHRKSAKH